jgi:cytochrome bd-type quinol oxidase subunit 2
MQMPPAKKTHFGLAALIAGILCVLSLLTNYGVAQLNISQETFNQLNNLTALFYCVLTPPAFALGAIGLTHRNDSKSLSSAGVLLALIPFLVIFGRFISSFIK